MSELKSAPKDDPLVLSDTRLQIHALNAALTGSRFEDVDLSGGLFRDANLAGARFADVNLAGATIDNADMTDMTINGVKVADLFAAYKAKG